MRLLLDGSPADKPSEKYKILLAQSVYEHNSLFLHHLEKWLLAMLQSKYGESDEVIIKKVLESCETALASNISFHELMAKEMQTNEPVIARQHRLLAKIYAALSNMKQP